MAKKHQKKSKKNKKFSESPTNSIEDLRKKVTVKTVKTSASKRPSVAKKGHAVQRELVFGRENYKWIGIGIALIGLGMLLMIGGFNENPNEWDESSIYSMRRILLAPIVILSGLAVQVYAIFK